jgi:hypothetical protein
MDDQVSCNNIPIVCGWIHPPKLEHKHKNIKLNIYNLTAETEKQKNLYEHIIRMAENRLPRTLLNYKPEESSVIIRQ